MLEIQSFDKWKLKSGEYQKNILKNYRSKNISIPHLEKAGPKGQKRDQKGTNFLKKSLRGTENPKRDRLVITAIPQGYS